MRETLLRRPGILPGTGEGDALGLNFERAGAMLEFSSEILSILDAGVFALISGVSMVLAPIHNWTAEPRAPLH